MSRAKILDVINAINTLELKMNVLSGANELHMAQLDLMRTYMFTKLEQQEIEVLEYVDGDKLSNLQGVIDIMNTVTNARKNVDARQSAKGVEFILEVFPHSGVGKEEYLLMIMPNTLDKMAELEYYLNGLSFEGTTLLNGNIFKGKQWHDRQKEAKQYYEEYDEGWCEEEDY